MQEQNKPNVRKARSILIDNMNGGTADDDPDMPKRPPNAYMLFCNDRREKLLQAEPNLNYKTVMTRLGELWNSLPQEERQPYIEEARQNQLSFKAKYPDYKYKPRKPKPARQQPNQLTLPNGISHAEASYLMLLGAQTLLNQKGAQGQPMNQQIQLPDDPNYKTKGKMDDVHPFITEALPLQLSSFGPDKITPVNALSAAIQLQAQQPKNQILPQMSIQQPAANYNWNNQPDKQ